MVKKIKKIKKSTRSPISFDPIDREILRVLSKARMSATPSKIARTINIHPSTAKVRVQRLSKQGLVELKSRGNRTLVKSKKKIKK